MKRYQTAEVAALIGIHPNTVRFYEQSGLISKPARKNNGYREFTLLHIRQLMLARTAFQIEVVQNGLRKKIVDVVKTSARCDFDGAIALTRDYLSLLDRERANAEDAIQRVRDILSGKAREEALFLKRREAAAYLGVTMDALRNWEMNGLLTVKRTQNGYRVYSDDDMQRLVIIRSLRCANYSLAAILRMLRQLSANPDTDIRSALNAPAEEEDIISACDKLLISLSDAEKNAHLLIEMLCELKQTERQ